MCMTEEEHNNMVLEILTQDCELTGQQIYIPLRPDTTCIYLQPLTTHYCLRIIDDVFGEINLAIKHHCTRGVAKVMLNGRAIHSRVRFATAEKEIIFKFLEKYA